jgi:anti-sigma B factor antagonist
MDFNLSTHKDPAVLCIGGELDALSANELRPVIGRIGEDRPSRLLVDLSRLRLIDSSGVGAIVSLFKLVKAYGGAMSVEGVREQPLAILRLLQLDRVLMRDFPSQHTEISPSLAGPQPVLGRAAATVR